MSAVLPSKTSKDTDLLGEEERIGRIMLRTITMADGPLIRRLRCLVVQLDEACKEGTTSREHDEEVVRLGSVTVVHRIRNRTSVIEATSPRWMTKTVELHHDTGGRSWDLRSSLDLWKQAAEDADENRYECDGSAIAAAWIAADVTNAWPYVHPVDGSQAVHVHLPTPWSGATANAGIGSHYDEDYPLYVPLPSFRNLVDPERPLVAAIIDATIGPMVMVTSSMSEGREIMTMQSCLLELRSRRAPEGAGDLDAMDRLRILAIAARSGWDGNERNDGDE